LVGALRLLLLRNMLCNIGAKRRDGTLCQSSRPKADVTRPEGLYDNQKI
jgi:hypothetical protein